LVLENSERRDYDDSSRGKSPAKSGPRQPSAARGEANGLGRIRLRQGERDDVAAIATAGKMLKEKDPLAVGQRTFGEGGQRVRVGVIDDGRCRSQPLAHDLGDFLHISF